MARVMPKQVIRPAARLALGVHIGAAEEIGLNIHLLHVQFTRVDLILDPLVRRVKAAHLPRQRRTASWVSGGLVISLIAVLANSKSDDYTIETVS